MPGEHSRAQGRASPAGEAQPGAWRALADSFGHAFRGVVDTAVHQRNMRIHLVSGILVALVASAVPLGDAEQSALALCVFLVLSAEVANSALEALVDILSRDWHERARMAKDASAGAVLALAAGSLVVLVMVILHDWPSIVAARASALRQAIWGLPLAGIAAALLTPFRRPLAVDVALGAVGAALLVVLATFTASGPFTVLAALLFAASLAAALRRRRLQGVRQAWRPAGGLPQPGPRRDRAGESSPG
jgi:diacylglycerol kinase (ATP)